MSSQQKAGSSHQQPRLLQGSDLGRFLRPLFNWLFLIPFRNLDFSRYLIAKLSGKLIKRNNFCLKKNCTKQRIVFLKMWLFILLYNFATLSLKICIVRCTFLHSCIQLSKRWCVGRSSSWRTQVTAGHYVARM